MRYFAELFSGISLTAETVRNGILSLATFLGLYLAWLRVRAANRQSEAALQQSAVALRQAELSRRSHVAELFNKAVEQLVSEKLEVRLGAIFTLRQIANDFPDLAAPTFQLLSAYLRHHSTDYGDEGPPVDVAEVIETLKDRVALR